MKHYGFSSKFPTPLEPKGKDIVLQYELKLEEGLTCGGLYNVFVIVFVLITMFFCFVLFCLRREEIGCYYLSTLRRI